MLPERQRDAATVRAARRTRRRWRFTPRFYRLVAAFMAGYVLLAYWHGYARITAVRRQIEDVRHQLAALEARNRQLRATVAWLSSDEYVERVAREKLGLVRPGETRFVLTQPGASPSSNQPVAAPPAAQP